MFSFNKDYILFLDGGSLVPYHMDNCTYVPYPNTKVIEELELDYKFYIKTSIGYFVGTNASNYVRKIHPSDFKLVKNQIKINKEKEKVEDRNKVLIKTQLVMDFC